MTILKPILEMVFFYGCLFPSSRTNNYHLLKVLRETMGIRDWAKLISSHDQHQNIHADSKFYSKIQQSLMGYAWVSVPKGEWMDGCQSSERLVWLSIETLIYAVSMRSIETYNLIDAHTASIHLLKKYDIIQHDCWDMGTVCRVSRKACTAHTFDLRR